MLLVNMLVNMEVTRLRLRFMRRDSRVSLTALGEDSWYSHVSLRGRAVSIEDGPDLVDIDRLARRYTGKRSGAATRTGSAPGSRSSAGTRGICELRSASEPKAYPGPPGRLTGRLAQAEHPHRPLIFDDW
jgi:hypothetical protein